MPVTVLLQSYEAPYARVEHPVSDELASEIVTYLLSTNVQQRSPEATQRRVIAWRRQVREEAKAARQPKRSSTRAPAAPPAPSAAQVSREITQAVQLIETIEIAWLREACLLRVRDRLGYRRIADQIGKAKTSVRRHVPATLEALGIPNPDLVGEDTA